MTEDRALKRTVRRRMELSGEKYTMARRALEGGPRDGERYPWLYAPYWDELVEKFERDRVQRGEAVARAGIYSVLNGHQLFSVLTAFQVIAAGRSPSGPDFWLGQRPSIEGGAATIDLCAPLGTVGFAAEIDRNRRILDRMLTLIDIRSAGASEPSRAMAAKEREVIGVRGRRSAAAGRRMRDYKLRARELPHPPVDDSRHLHLRAPLGDGFRCARRGVDDPELLGLLDAWIDELDRNYSALVDGMPVAWHRHGELEFEAVAGDADLLGSRTVFLSPARMRVERCLRGDVGDYEPVATPWQVAEYSMRPQSDGIKMSDPGERWHICGHRFEDGTVMPCLGTYRLTLGSQPPPGLDESSPSDGGQGARITRLGPLFSWHGFSEQARECILAAVTLADTDDAAATPQHLRRVLQSPLPAKETADWVHTLFDELSLDLKTVLMRARQIGGDHIDAATLAAALDRAESGI